LLHSFVDKVQTADEKPRSQQENEAVETSKLAADFASL
jgi:hypothetical protein